MSEEVKKVPMGNTGFVRDDKRGVGRFDLVPWRAIWELAKHCEEGALRYGERNIDKGCPQHSLIDSAFRHLAKYMMGMNDEDHLRACLWNIAWAVHQDCERPDMQDIPARMSESVSLFSDNREVAKALVNMNERRCVEMTCFHNADGFCQSVSDTWEPTHGNLCADFSED